MTHIFRRVKNTDLYAKTEVNTQAYMASGYAVVEMWSHEFKEAEKSNGLLLSLLRRREPLCTSSKYGHCP